jgi:hypothetical protein
LTAGPFVKLNPRNFRSCGRATALFVSLTLSWSFCVINRVTLFFAGYSTGRVVTQFYPSAGL